MTARPEALYAAGVRISAGRKLTCCSRLAVGFGSFQASRPTGCVAFHSASSAGSGGKWLNGAVLPATAKHALAGKLSRASDTQDHPNGNAEHAKADLFVKQCGGQRQAKKRL
jgi:hypothetical protein